MLPNGNNIQYYPIDVSGHNYLKVSQDVYSQYFSNPNDKSEYLKVKCDINRKTMTVFKKTRNERNWERINNNDKIIQNSIFDLNDQGERWEGNGLNGEPYGFGCIYNKDNNLAYEGFIYKGMKVCYGCCHHADIEAIEYVGGFYMNKKHGYGKLYDKKRELLCDGNWFLDDSSTTKDLSIKNVYMPNHSRCSVC